jgi:hypothetical protein
MSRSNCLNLFAYGTLMDRDELAFDLVLPPSELDRRFRFRVGEATGWRRVYNKVLPDRGGAVLNLAPDKESSVVGVLVLDITNQELGMLDASFPGHLPRRPVEVLVEGEKVPAVAYIAKDVDPAATVSPEYEKRMLAIVAALGEPIESNYREQTYRADGSPAYRVAPAPPETDPPPAPPPAG